MNSQLIRNILNDAAPSHLGERTGQFDIAGQPNVRAARVGGDFVGDLGTCAVAALAVDTLGFDARRMGIGIVVEDRGFALKRGVDRAEFDFDFTFVGGIAGLPDELEPRHAGDHFGYVLEELPNTSDGLVDVERCFDSGHDEMASCQVGAGAEPKRIG